MPQEKKGPVTELEESFSKLDSDCKRLQQDYLRALADFDNYRRRMERDLELNQRLALERLVMDLLPVLDNFDRALAALGNGSTAESVQKGMELIRRQLSEAVCRHGVSEYSCVGQEFDPRSAEAIGYVQSNDQKPNFVVTETCRGYRCGDKVLRPARVIVAKPPSEVRPEAEGQVSVTGTLEIED